MDTGVSGRVVEQHPHGDVTPRFVVGHAEMVHVANQRGIEFHHPSIDQDHRGDRGNHLAAGSDAKEGFSGRHCGMGPADRSERLGPQEALTIHEGDGDRCRLALTPGQFLQDLGAGNGDCGGIGDRQIVIVVAATGPVMEVSTSAANVGARHGCLLCGPRLESTESLSAMGFTPQMASDERFVVRVPIRRMIIAPNGPNRKSRG